FRPKDFKELFNLHHTQACNTIVCIFGVIKRHFQLIVAALEYALEVQSKLVPTFYILHNFIHIHDPDDSNNEGD
ncbi:hypothetical protein SERLA73DRAFT_27336, partial [Serpula lacrymans var. lacrymans S7.3]